MRTRHLGLGIAILALVLPLATKANAERAGDLLITPTRVQMTDRSRAGVVVVANLSRSAVRYRVNLIDMRMMPDGSLQRVEGDSGNSAKGFVRYSPREIALAPGASQTIRILALPPADKAAGEVRSHFEFVPIVRGTPRPEGFQASPGLRLDLDIRMVVTIPVILDWGRTASAVKLTHGSVVRIGPGWAADFTIERQGNATARGDIVATFRPANGGASTGLGRLASLPVYFPNEERRVRLPFSADLAKLGKGEVEIAFTSTDQRRDPATRLVIQVGG